jgi:uncharacterized protein involved in exopolysaccharide biosynthesis
MAEIHSRTLRKIGRFPHLTGWLNFLGALLGAGAVATVMALYGPASYQATSSVLFPLPESSAAAPAAGASSGASSPASASAVASSQPVLVGPEKFMLLLQSRTLQDAVIHRVKLDEKLGFDLGWTREIFTNLVKFTVTPGTGLSVTATAEGCRLPIKGSWVIPALDYEGAQKLCADLANACVEELHAQVTGINTDQATHNYDFAAQNAAHTRDHLLEVETRLVNLESRERFLDPSGKAAIIAARLQALETARDANLAHERELAQSLGVAQGKLHKTDALAISSRVEQRNPVVGTLEDKLAQLQLQKATLLAQGKTEQQRDVALLTAQIAELEAQRAGLVEAVLKEIDTGTNPAYTDLLHSVTQDEVELAGARAGERAYTGLQAEANRSLAALPPVSQEYAALSREREALAGVMANLSRQREEASLQVRAAQRDPFYVLDRAEPPVYGYGPYIGRATIIAFVVLLGVLWLITGIKRGLFDFFRL